MSPFILPQMKLGVLFFSLSLVANSFAGVCDRNPAIVTELTRVLNENCELIGEDDLASISSLSLYLYKPVAFKALDFEGLTNLKNLTLYSYSYLEGGDFEPGALSQLENLESLKLFQSNLYGETPFVGLKNLKKLTLFLCKMKKITPEFFTGLSKLKSLTLSGNDLFYFPSNVGKMLPDLEVFDLQGEFDFAFADDAFRQFNKLKILSINNLTSLKMKSGMLVGLNALIKVSISNLKDLYIESRALGDVPNLQSINLSGISKLTVENSFLFSAPSLRDFTLSASLVSPEIWKQISTPALNSLENLFLDSNTDPYVFDDEFFRHIPNLKYLSCFNCKVFFRGKPFDLAPQLRRINFSNARLEQFGYEHLMGLKYLYEINLKRVITPQLAEELEHHFPNLRVLH